MRVRLTGVDETVEKRTDKSHEFEKSLISNPLALDAKRILKYEVLIRSLRLTLEFVVVLFVFLRLCQLDAKEDFVSPGTENLFQDDFWESLDFVTNALDNVKARLYVDSR